MTFADIIKNANWKIKRNFLISKWIRDKEKLLILANVFHSIQLKFRENPNPPNFGDLNGFVEKAIINAVHGDASTPSKFMEKELQSMLESISDNRLMRKFLGPWGQNRNRSTIGGSISNPWISGKMFCFLANITGWDGISNQIRAFRHDHGIYNQHVIESDIAQYGSNLGGIFRCRIQQVLENNGSLPSNDIQSMVSARISARPSPWKPAASSSISLQSARSSVSPVSPRASYTPQPSARSVCVQDLCRDPVSVYLEYFFSLLLSLKVFKVLNDVFDTETVPELKSLHAILLKYRRDYPGKGNLILSYKPVQEAILSDLRDLSLIKQALLKVSAISLEEVAESRTPADCIRFVEVLLVIIKHKSWEQLDQNIEKKFSWTSPLTNTEWTFDSSTFTIRNPEILVQGIEMA